MERRAAFHRRRAAHARQRAAGFHRPRAGVHGRRAVFGHARALGGPRRDGVSLLAAEQRHPVRERAGARREPAHVQTSAARGRRRVARARRRTRRLPRCRRARRRRSDSAQARHRAHRQHLRDLRRHQRLHRADPREHLHAQDAVGFVQRAQSGVAEGAGREGPDTEETWQSILAHEGSVQHLDASERRREVGVPHRVRDRPALGRRARRRSRAAHLPGPVAEPLSAQRHPQMGPADAALDGVGARREVAVLLPQQERAARRLRRRRGRQHARVARESPGAPKPTTANTTSASHVSNHPSTRSN